MVEITRKGYLELVYGGSVLSRHTAVEEAYERALRHYEAFRDAPGYTGLYTVRYPDREIDLSTLVKQFPGVADPASWSLPATISVQQSGSVGLRQYVNNGTGWTISVSGLPAGVTYNAGTESLEGASTGTASATVTFTLTLGATTVQATATVSLFEAGTVSASITASRISGPAPLPVLFNASDTTHANGSIRTFGELGYYFDFGETTAEVWTHSGKSKDIQRGGPLAAHVYETPGTYTVRVRARDAAGNVDDAQVTITVQDPDVVYSGTNTVCLSRTGDHTGAPAGAQLLSNVTSWPTFERNKRYLLRAGQDFSSLGTLEFQVSGSIGMRDAQLGSYGTGAKPIVAALSCNTPSNANEDAQRVAIYGLDALSFFNYRYATDLYLLNCDFVRGGIVDFASAWDYFISNGLAGAGYKHPSNLFMVECTVDRNYSQAGNVVNGIQASGTNLVFMGNHVRRTYEHNIRIWQCRNLFFGHNWHTGECGGEIRGAVKIHSAGVREFAGLTITDTDPTFLSERIVLADSKLGSPQSNINWLCGVAAQNNIEAELCRDVIYEGNRCEHGTNYFRDFSFGGGAFWARDCLNVTDGVASQIDEAGQVALEAAYPGITGPYSPSFPPQTSIPAAPITTEAPA